MDGSGNMCCARCGTTTEHLSKCSRCRAVWYCGKACQREHWKLEHKRVCRQVQVPPAAAAAAPKLSSSSSSSTKPSTAPAAKPKPKPAPKTKGHVGRVPGKSKTQPYAMWRKKSGTEWFMGIVCYDGGNRLVKLDRPSGELDGPGHEMDDGEFMSECFHYDSFVLRHSEFERQVGLPPKMDGLNLTDFAGKPQYFTDQEDHRFTVKYPHGVAPPANRRRTVGPTPQIRNGDRVKVVSVGITVRGGFPYRERFWVQVLSVTATGMVTGYCRNKLNSGIAQEDELIAFPVTRVLGVIHEDRWG